MAATENTQEAVPFTEWAYGFRPGRTGRNVLIGVVYWFTIFVSIFVLVYGWYQNADRVSDASKGGITFLAILVVFMYAASGIGAIATGPGETVVDIDAREQTSEQFEAEEGDLIQIHITQPQGEGTRTYVLLTGPEENLLRESVLEEETFEREISETGTYSVTMTPTDNQISTSGKIEIVLIEAENRGDS